jgi:hypothetical protein
MPYLVPPMDPEPPGDYLAFVADNLAVVRDEAARLVGGDAHADEIYPEVLADVAGRWRRLRLLHRLGRRDATSDFLSRRLATRAKQWREDQIYTVDIRPLRPPTAAQAGLIADTMAQRLAPLLPPTVRLQQRPVAEAAIAWAHAYSRHRLRRLARLGVAIVLMFGTFVQLLPQLPNH